jgi:predicted transcriptional regulator
MSQVKRNYSSELLQMARFAKALAHPARLQILRFLDRSDRCITGNIVSQLPIAQSSVSQHLKELKDAGLIQGTIEAPKIYYCINRKNWQLAQLHFMQFFQTEGELTQSTTSTTTTIDEL